MQVPGPQIEQPTKRMGNLFSSGTPNEDLLEADRRHAVGADRIEEYPVKEPVGVALLFGSDSSPVSGDGADDEERLKSVKIDLIRMENSLSHCGFKVMNPCLDRASPRVTLLHEMISNTIQKLRSDPDLNKYSCFLFYFTGHGISRGILLSEDHAIPAAEKGVLPFSTIVQTISNILATHSKPKIFIFDCCRTDHDYRSLENAEVKSGSERDYQADTEHTLNSQKEPEVYPPADSLLCFAAVDTQPSWGDKYGSFYTFHLATILRKYHKRASICDIVNDARAKLSACPTCSSYIHPIMESTLNGRLILNREFLGRLTPGAWADFGVSVWLANRK